MCQLENTQIIIYSKWFTTLSLFDLRFEKRPPHSLLPIFEKCLTAFGAPILLPRHPQQCYSHHIPLSPTTVQFCILLRIRHGFFLKKNEPKQVLRNFTWTSKSWPLPRVNPTNTKGRDGGQRQKSHTNTPTTSAHCGDFPNRLSSASGDTKGNT